jgi:hypothetical protein
LFDAAHRAHGGVASFVDGHASRDVRFDAAFEVVAELVLKVLLNLIAAEQGPNA